MIPRRDKSLLGSALCNTCGGFDFIFIVLCMYVFMLGPSSVFGMRPKAAASIHISLSYLCVGWYTIIGPHLF